MGNARRMGHSSSFPVSLRAQQGQPGAVQSCRYMARGAVSGQSFCLALAINHLLTLPVKAEAFLSASVSSVGTSAAQGSACTQSSSSGIPGVSYSEGLCLLRLRPIAWARHLTVPVPALGISLLLVPQQLCPAQEVPVGPDAAALWVLVGFSC